MTLADTVLQLVWFKRDPRVAEHEPLTPVALGLLARAGLEAALRQTRYGRFKPQRRDRATHDHIAALEAALGAQLLPQDARRVVHLGCALGEPVPVRIEQAAACRAPVRLPR